MNRLLDATDTPFGKAVQPSVVKETYSKRQIGRPGGE